MPISATEHPTGAASALREATRRLTHHAGNVANAAAVNVEVLRSRLERGTADPDALAPFAQRAAAALEQVAAGTALMRKLLAILAEAASRGAPVRAVAGDPGAVEVTVAGVSFETAAVRFAAAAGVELGTTARGVILRLLRHGAVTDDVTA